MMYKLALLFSLFLFAAPKNEVPKSIYDFEVDGLPGGKIKLSKFKGKKILIVNTASKCGYTYQYEGLEKLYKKYQDKLVIIGFPANNFGAQEPGSNQDIEQFCKKNYGVSFPMAAKISVKGENIHELYLWLTKKRYNGVSDNEVAWNFQKYLIDEKGNFVTYFKSDVKPDDAQLIDAINK